MNDPLQVLLKIKRLKEEQALKHLAAMRKAAEIAAQERERARAREAESARSLPVREDAVYRKVLGETISLGRLDETRGEIALLERSHQALRDESERAIHVEARALDRVEQARKARLDQQRQVDKYVIITDLRAAEAAAAEESAEEAEVEDQLSRPRRRSLS
jgi:hypothetical protein